jgi:type IV conjugative transfer system protein TraE
MDKMETSFSDAVHKNKFQEMIIGGLVIAVILLIVMLMARNEHIMPIPPNLPEGAWISENDASPEYKAAWAMMTSSLLGNVTPTTADDVQKNLRSLFTPVVYRQIEDAVLRQVRVIKNETLVVRFTPIERIYEPETEKYFVTGQLETTGPSGDSEVIHRTFEYKIGVTMWQPMINFFTVYEGRPRTIQFES